MSGAAPPAPPAPRPEWAYYLDVDGTLVAIADRPSAVRVPPATGALIRAVHERTGGAVALVSGRSIADLDGLFGTPWLPMAGQHGVEQRAPGVPGRADGPDVALLAPVRARLAAFVARRAGLLLEDKQRSLAVHYRLAPRFAGAVHAVVRAEQRALGAAWTVQRGRRVVELRPAGAGKGRAVERFASAAPFRGRLPVAIGDDVTDEDSFAWVNAAGGHSIRVGPGRTVARWRLADHAAVVTWLQQLLVRDP